MVRSRATRRWSRDLYDASRWYPAWRSTPPLLPSTVITWANGQKRSEIGTLSFVRASSEPVMPILWIMESNHAAELWAEVLINWRDRNEHETPWPIRYSRGQKKARARHHRLTQHSTLNSGMSRQVEGMSESRQCVLGAQVSAVVPKNWPIPRRDNMFLGSEAPGRKNVGNGRTRVGATKSRYPRLGWPRMRENRFECHWRAKTCEEARYGSAHWIFGFEPHLRWLCSCHGCTQSLPWNPTTMLLSTLTLIKHEAFLRF